MQHIELVSHMGSLEPHLWFESVFWATASGFDAAQGGRGIRTRDDGDDIVGWAIGLVVVVVLLIAFVFAIPASDSSRIERKRRRQLRRMEGVGRQGGRRYLRRR
ncbi:hypothetical protein ACIBCD_41595 [Nocardia brasiliensis]|uniref:hypothetical protein n=1 Tax=Nocardia brasiliensis TaxID=37326 RepID=UPI003799F5EC